MSDVTPLSAARYSARADYAISPPRLPDLPAVFTDRLCVDENGDLRLTAYPTRTLRPAVSCLIQPEAGDVVCVLLDQPLAYVLAVLQRQSTDAPLVLDSGTRPLHLTAPTLALHAAEQIALCSGNFSLQTGLAHCFAHTLHQVTQALFITTQQAHRKVTHLDATEAGHISQHAEQSLTLHGHIGSIHASAALRIDGAQVHMG